MSKVRIRCLPGGAIKSVYADGYPFHKHGRAVPRRGSQVEPVQEGWNAGQFSVDFSPLGEEFQFCLARTYKRRDEALKAEVDWLDKNWLTASEVEKQVELPCG